MIKLWRVGDIPSNHWLQEIKILVLYLENQRFSREIHKMIIVNKMWDINPRSSFGPSIS